MTIPAPESSPVSDAPVKKRWFQKKWVWALVGAVVLIGVISNLVDPPDDVAEPVPSETVEASSTAPVEETVEASPAPPVESAAPVESDEAAVGIADTVWANVLEAFGGSVSTGSPLFAVTDVESLGSTTMRVYVQENLDDAGREEIARHVFNMGAFDLTQLDTIVVRDASGIDSNHYRRDFPHLPQ